MPSFCLCTNVPVGGNTSVGANSQSPTSRTCRLVAELERSRCPFPGENGHTAEMTAPGVLQQRVQLRPSRGCIGVPAVVPADDRIRRGVMFEPASASAT